MERKEVWQKLLQESYGFSDEQLTKQFDLLAKQVKEEDKKDCGGYEALKRRIEELEKQKSETKE